MVSATGTVLPCISQGTSNLIVAKGGNNVIDAPDVARVVYALLLAPVQVGECAATELQEEGNLPVMAGAAGEVFDLFLVLRIDDWALASEAADMFGATKTSSVVLTQMRSTPRCKISRYEA